MNILVTDFVKFDPQLERLYTELEDNPYPTDPELARIYDEESTEVPVASDIPAHNLFRHTYRPTLEPWSSP